MSNRTLPYRDARNLPSNFSSCKLFILNKLCDINSWPGVRRKMFATKLENYIPTLLQKVDPFLLALVIRSALALEGGSTVPAEAVQ